MYSLIFLAIASFVLSLLLTPLVRNLALRLDVVDHPDGVRKTHRAPIPRVGGVAIFAATISAYALLLLVRLSAGHIVRSGVPFALRLLPAVILIFCVGLIDDILDIRPQFKLAAQFVAATLAWASGVRVGAIGGHPFPVAISFIVTLVWIVACSNAVNLIDGVDGLAVGIGLFATITTVVASLLHRNIELAFAAVPLAGALLGFLRYNFSPASIFLGDCGSLTLGFLLGCYGIVWSEKSTNLISMTAPLVVLSVPLLDAGLAIGRRYIRQQPIFRADRAHIHHKMLARGLAPHHVVFILYGFCGLAAAAALLLTAVREQYHGFVVVIVCLAGWLGLQHLGYNEFGVAGQLAASGAFRGLLNAQLMLSEFEQELTESTTLEQCWDVLCSAGPQFGFSGIELNLDGTVLGRQVSGGWHVRIDLPGHGHITLTRQPGATDRGDSAVFFIDLISRVFLQKLNILKSDQHELTPYA